MRDYLEKPIERPKEILFINNFTGRRLEAGEGLGDDLLIAFLKGEIKIREIPKLIEVNMKTGA
ncbi:MAG: hypothetical protein WAV41_03095 [Microgenomates group bacterium]